MKKAIDFIKRIEWDKISVATYVRYILMIISVINIIITRLGCNPIEVSETELYQTVSDIITVVVLIVNTWCNNSVSPEAIAADAALLASKCLNNDAATDTESEDTTESDK
jgi:SPP1 family holin